MSDVKTSVTIRLPTNQKFGWFFAFLFAALGVWAYFQKLNNLALATLICSLTLAFLTLIAPQMLSPLNRLWYELGQLLGKVVSPIVLGILFFVLITPVSLITRLFGRDELRMKKRAVDSYWVDRSPDPNLPSDSFKKQY